jgi:hypothetical protein
LPCHEVGYSFTELRRHPIHPDCRFNYLCRRYALCNQYPTCPTSWLLSKLLLGKHLYDAIMHMLSITICDYATHRFSLARLESFCFRCVRIIVFSVPKQQFRLVQTARVCIGSFARQVPSSSTATRRRLIPPTFVFRIAKGQTSYKSIILQVARCQRWLLRARTRSHSFQHQRRACASYTISGHIL